MPVISFKVSAAEARAIKSRARAKKKTVSAYLRERALPQPRRARKLIIRRHTLSGLPYDATPGPLVTDEEIRAALADFP